MELSRRTCATASVESQRMSHGRRAHLAASARPHGESKFRSWQFSTEKAFLMTEVKKFKW